jgi:hypothetical protein
MLIKSCFLSAGVFVRKEEQTSRMYPNPFDRKHSTIRQVIDRILFPESRAHPKKGGLGNLAVPVGGGWGSGRNPTKGGRKISPGK